MASILNIVLLLNSNSNFADDQRMKFLKRRETIINKFVGGVHWPENNPLSTQEIQGEEKQFKAAVICNLVRQQTHHRWQVVNKPSYKHWVEGKKNHEGYQNIRKQRAGGYTAVENKCPNQEMLFLNSVPSLDKNIRLNLALM